MSVRPVATLSRLWRLLVMVRFPCRTCRTPDLADDGLRGNVVPDAWLAALALSHGAAMGTRDRGFARFPGVSLVAPG